MKKVCDDQKSNIENKDLVISELKTLIDAEKTAVLGLTSEKTQLSNDINLLKSQLETEKSNFANLKGDHQTLTNTAADTKSHLDESTKANQDLNTKIAELKNEIKMFEVQLDAHSKSYESLTGDYVVAKQTISQLTADLANQKGANTELQNEKIERNNDMKHQVLQIETLTKEAAANRQKISELEAELKTYEAAVHSLNGTVKGLEETGDGLDAEISDLTLDVKDKLEVIAGLEDQAAANFDQNESLAQELQEK
jgi:chromosome segregation ATPase